MSKGYSDLFSGTKGDLLAKSQRTKTFQGNRSKEEYSSLARDPARGKKVDHKGTKERDIALDLERQGLIGKVIRDPQADKGADFIDTTTGQNGI